MQRAEVRQLIERTGDRGDDFIFGFCDASWRYLEAGTHSRPAGHLHSASYPELAARFSQ